MQLWKELFDHDDQKSGFGDKSDGQRDRDLSAAIEEVHIFGMTAIFRLWSYEKAAAGLI